MPDGAPAASVIVPVRNGADVIVAQLDALRAQVARNDLEVIVVDDASTDSTAKVIEAWIADRGDGRFRCIQRPVRGGGMASRQTGVNAARADFLLFCDGDDVVADEWSDALLAVPRDERALLCGAMVEFVDGGPIGEGLRRPAASALWHRRPYAYGGNMAMTRTLFELVGIDAANAQWGADVDFSLRALELDGASIVPVEAAVVNYRQPGSAFGLAVRAFQQERGLVRVDQATVTVRAWVAGWRPAAAHVLRLGQPSARRALGALVGRQLGTSRRLLRR
jgi:glycosyltransferase involved in cell wall biosynthesis